jgi:hypothetical protein
VGEGCRSWSSSCNIEVIYKWQVLFKCRHIKVSCCSVTGPIILTPGCRVLLEKLTGS